MLGRVGIGFVFGTILVALAGCVSLVADYDPQFDQSLNQLSEDTAKFLAGAEAGGPERSANSKETVAYYATTYNLLDRLSQRAAIQRGSVKCPNNADLKTFSEQPTSKSVLPDDYVSFDCLEANLYYVRFFVDQLSSAQEQGGSLNRSEAIIAGGQLQTSISGAIQAFLVTRKT